MDAVETFDPLRSRPNTPVKVVWYDFLLDDGLLERHLSQENPDPPALHLAAEFVYQYQVGKQNCSLRLQGGRNRGTLGTLCFVTIAQKSDL